MVKLVQVKMKGVNMVNLKVLKDIVKVKLKAAKVKEMKGSNVKIAMVREVSDEGQGENGKVQLRMKVRE